MNVPRWSRWEAAADLHVDAMCDGIDRDGIVLCRAVPFSMRELFTDPRA